MPAHTTLFLRHDVYRRFGRFKLDYVIAADFDFICRIFRDGRIKTHYIPKVLVHMQIGGVSTGGWKNSMLLNKEVVRACHENGISTNLLKILTKYPLKLLEHFRK